jgi:hypothetical protein
VLVTSFVTASSKKVLGTDNISQPPDEMKVAEKACYEASRCLLNLSLAIKTPSPEQAEIFRGRVTDLRDEVERMRSIFLR